MNNLSGHPSVIRYHATKTSAGPASPLSKRTVDTVWLKQLARDFGADDVGVLSLERPELDNQRQEILQAFPETRALVCFVCRLNPPSIRAAARSVANLEFHENYDHSDRIARELVMALREEGIAALHPASGFPMEMDRFPGRIWIVAHKPVAEAVGLGRMGIHRNVIHPRFGSFITLATVCIAAAPSEEDHPIDYNPCLSCKLCVAACPVAALSPEGRFDFQACMTHNYREFMSGFTDWVQTIADSRNAKDYRRRVTDAESTSMWQSLAFKPNYKAAYCMSVCPAGDEVIGPFLERREEYLERVVRPLQDKEEPVYVVPGSDAEDHVRDRYPHKRVRHVKAGLRPTTIDNFLASLPLVFQRGKARGLDATYQFTFTGQRRRLATVRIQAQRLQIHLGHIGIPRIRVWVDADAWLGIVRKDISIPWAIITGRLRALGNPLLLLRFNQCFPV